MHIDDLRPTSDTTIMPYEAMDTPISQLFLSIVTPNDQIGSLMDQGGTADMDDKNSEVQMDGKQSKPPANVDSTEMPSLLTDDNEGENMDEDKVPSEDEQMSEIHSDTECLEEETMEEEHPISTGIVGDELPRPTTLPAAQCQRLHGCIQAAASRLQDDNKRRATQRVEILVNLVPKDITLPLGKPLETVT